MNLSFDADFDPNHRELCDDGACIGVIGPDGSCRECGRPSRSSTVDPRHRGLRTTQEIQEEELPAPITTAPNNLDDGGGSFEDRQLCPDGACIGILGPNGNCTECGAS